MNIQYQKYKEPTLVFVKEQKSCRTAILLAFLFGPIGLLYGSSLGGLIMFLIGALLFLKALIVAFVLLWVGCIIWSILAVSDYNKKPTREFMIKYKFNFKHF